MVSTSITNWKPVMKLIANQVSVYHIRIFFDLMDSVVVIAHAIYKKKVNAKMTLLNFEIILVELLINQLCSWKCKITAQEPQLIVELLQPLKERDHIVQFTEKRQCCQCCFTNGKKDGKCITYYKSCNVLLCV